MVQTLLLVQQHLHADNVSPESSDEALRLSAQKAFEAGDWATSLSGWEQLAQRHPGAPGPLFMQGATLHAERKLGLALAKFLQTIALAPQLQQAHLAAATVLGELARHEEALVHCLKAIELNAMDPVAHINTGIVHEALGHQTPAAAAYNEALRIDPNNINALKNIGALYLHQGNTPAALTNARIFIARYPNRKDAQFQLGEALLANHLYSEASTAFALVSKNCISEDAKAIFYRGFSEAQQQHFTESQQLLDLAWQLNPMAVNEFRQLIFANNTQLSGPLDARTLYLLATYDRAEICDWRDGECLTDIWNIVLCNETERIERALGFRAMAVGVTQETQLKLARYIARDLPSPTETSRKFMPLERIRLRIGYLSPDLRNHALGHLLKHLFSLHDRQCFEVFTYSIAQANDDPVRHCIQAGSDTFCECAHLSDYEVAEHIKKDQLDILIDLAGYTDKARPGVLALRPAPIQISWLGYLATTGTDWMDYVVLDPVSAPAGDDVFYSEAIIRLPSTTFFCSYSANPPANPPSRHSAGLPSQGRIIAAFHNGYKIDPQVFSIWMRLLAAAPDAYLWLLDGSPKLVTNLYQEAEKRGIPRSRLIFAPRLPFDEHLSRFSLADLLLDTLRCNGGTTVCDALVAGVPVITCAGTGFSRRMAASNLLAAGFPDGVTYSPEEYEAKAQEWLSNTGYLDQLREKIRAQRTSSVFFQPKRWLLKFEQALLHAAKRNRENLPPAAFSIDQ